MVCVIGGGVGRGVGKEFVFPLIFPFIYFSGVDLPIEGDFPAEIYSQPSSYNLHGKMFPFSTCSLLGRCLCDHYTGLEVALFHSMPYEGVCSSLCGSLF